MPFQIPRDSHACVICFCNCQDKAYPSNYRVFNKEGEKVKAYYRPKKLHFKVNLNFHSHQNLLTFDNLHQEYQIFQLEIHVETCLFLGK